MNFESFGKIPRLSRRVIVTEKIDGTNSQVCIGENGEFFVGSRNRWLEEGSDNFGFYAWCMANKDELLKLGPGRHFGEWWGGGIQRGYGLKEKRFSLFNTSRWSESRPSCCHVVPVLFDGIFDTQVISGSLGLLGKVGSHAAPGFMDPEGVVVYHVAGNLFFKKTLKKDEAHKGEQ